MNNHPLKNISRFIYLINRYVSDIIKIIIFKLFF
nr:MAG TPA: hypothetical protein [Bacteriophage sp.]